MNTDLSLVYCRSDVNGTSANNRIGRDAITMLPMGRDSVPMRYFSWSRRFRAASEQEINS